MSKKQAYIITIANQKGGSGKSTIAVNLAVKLVNLGLQVLVMDTDPQKSIESFTNIRESEALQSKKLRHFTLTNRTGNISESLKQSLVLYDYIIIDTGGIDSQESRKAMLYADAILLPTTPSRFDVDALRAMLGIIGEIKDINEDAKVCILMNKISTNVFLGKELLDYKSGVEDIKKELGLKDEISVLGGVLKERISYKRAVSEGLGISEYDDSKARAEFEDFFDEFSHTAKMPLNFKKSSGKSR